MDFLITTVLLYIAALLVHLVVWRIKLPKYHTRALLRIFAGVGLFGLSILRCRGLSSAACFEIGAFYLSLALCYVITYSALEGDSPTLSLIQMLSQSGKSGVSAVDVDAFLAARPFIRARLAALRTDALVAVDEDGKYRITGRPPKLFQLVLTFRKIFGRIQTGG